MESLISEMSFKMDRKSPLASKIKSSISRKLLGFIENFSDDDDVLAEYITVLVCNGKHQHEAQDDLEAFLGQRSSEFVTWLWDLLSEYTSKNKINGISKDVLVSNSHDRDAVKNQEKNAENATNSLIKGEKCNDRSTSPRKRKGSSDMEIVESIHQRRVFYDSANELNPREVSPQPYNRKRPRKSDPNDGHTGDDFRAHSDPLMADSPTTQLEENQSIQCSDTSKKVGLPNQLIYLPRKALHSKDIPSIRSEISHPRQSVNVGVSKRSLSPKSVDVAAYQQNTKYRRSVWDRLGKPCEDTLEMDDSVYVNGIEKREKELVDERSFLVPLPRDKCGSSSTEALKSGNRVVKKHAHLNHTANTMRSTQAPDNITRIDFGKTSTDAATSTGAHLNTLEKDRNVVYTKENFQDSKIPSRTSQLVKIIAPPTLVSELSKADKSSLIKADSSVPTPLRSQVLDVKLRLRQMEMEMSKLKKKQAEMKKDGKSTSNFCALRNTQENIKARTVLVTNVHFAATKEALMSHFATCGSIVNVTILTDLITGQPKGMAYITFSSEDSSEKALELSGTSFYSRIVKVLRKAEAGAFISSAAAQGGQRANPNSNLQWRRESVTVPSEKPTSTEKMVPAPASS